MIPTPVEDIRISPLIDRVRKILRSRAFPPALCFFAGMLAAYAMPPKGHWLCLFAGIGLFFALLNKVRAPVVGFRYGWLFGFGFFLIGLYWVGNALLVEGNPYRWAWPIALVALPGALALFPAAAVALHVKYLPENIYSRYLQFIVVMSLAEWLRGHLLTGFPWNLFAYGWSDSPQISQSVSLGGVYFLSFLTLLWASWPGLIFTVGRVTKPGVLLTTAFIVLSFAFFYSFGASRLDSVTQFDKDFRIKIVQPSIPQSEKWSSEKLDVHYEKILSLSGSDLEDIKTTTGRTLIVWPETALSWQILDNQSAREQISVLLKSYPHESVLATGVLRRERVDENRFEYRNSLTLFDSSARALDVYDKAHLVPFGEYIPMQHWIPIPPVAGFSGFVAGEGRKAMTLPGGYLFSPLICYEIIFPGSVVPAGGSPRPNAIVNVTNDAWYGNSAGPYQHLQHAVFRAIEEGIPVIRAANNGISAIIDPYGRFVARIPLNAERGARAWLPKPSPNGTPYSQKGDMLFFIFLVFFVAFKAFLDNVRI